MVLLKNLLIPTLSSSLISLFAEVLDSPVELKIGAFGFACSIFDSWAFNFLNYSVLNP
jgi:hypothetical protein